jgi:hypothetical protein
MYKKFSRRRSWNSLRRWVRKWAAANLLSTSVENELQNVVKLF